jgi:hypothetical protein
MTSKRTRVLSNGQPEPVGVAALPCQSGEPLDITVSSSLVISQSQSFVAELLLEPAVLLDERLDGVGQGGEQEPQERIVDQWAELSTFKRPT